MFYTFNATTQIAQAFDESSIKYVVRSDSDDYPTFEVVIARFLIEDGVVISLLFTTRNNENNDVAVRIQDMINVPEDKLSKVIELCNALNTQYRYLKFYVGNGKVNVEYDFPASTPDDAIGDMAKEIYLRTRVIMNEVYSVFMKAIYA